MDNKCYAAIDIGSNAVRLLIKKEVESLDNKGTCLEKALMLRVPLRLGFDVFAKGEISNIKANKMRRLMKAYRQLMKIYEVTDYRACATSAMRDAANGKAIIDKIEKDSGIKIEIISGQEEARLIYNNHMEYMEDSCGNYIYVDVGGGSTEVNLLVDGSLVKSMSYDIGTVRMLNHAVAPETCLKLREDMELLYAKYGEINIIGSGGNINKLYRLSKVKSDDKKMTIDSLHKLFNELQPLTNRERMNKFGLKPDRADVIIPAAEIFLTIATIIKSSYISVPVLGLSDGIIDDMYARNRHIEM